MIFRVQENTITAYGTIWSGNGMEFVSLLSLVEAKHKEITIKLHTYGGSVFDGNLMANALRDSKSKIRLEIVGIAASMGFVISLYLKDVYMVSNGYLMAHAPSGYTEGTALDHENNAKLLRSIEKNFIKILIEKTGKTESYVKKWLVGDNWMDAEEAKKEGLIKDFLDPETETEDFNPEQLGMTETYNRFSALLNPKNDLHNNLSDTMKKPIIEALGLIGVDANSSDTAVIDAVRNHYDAKITKAEADLRIANEKVVVAEAALKEQSKTAITAVIEAAKKAGKITQDQVATYESIAEASGIDALNTVLGAIPARNPITSQIQNQGGANNAPVGRDDWDFDKWQKEDPKALEAMAGKEPEKFKELFNAKYKK
ncbi:Clp protease ClpP [Flavobacterium aquicola]|uniref:ATP-dependent protease ClpP protease subunit n=1 Tax=Flavobacterium aquicola TaxID=1682742 RepID=A0A3E0EQ91_9FLAO|nr:Clp protease ClpP [Flavobacterium aquicola]REH00276.1 ATP-dependent protease ClpP protease subunit [Flavobacterium aquicola]